MMNTYRQGGEARVYWLTLPLPRDGDLAEVARAVNAAIERGRRSRSARRCACST